MKSPAFQFYAADYLADANVAMMSLEQEGIYIRLIAYCWREGSIPNDDEMLSRLCKGASTTALRVVKDCFKQHPNDPTKLVHGRLDQEREKQERWREKSSEGGRKSAAKRSESMGKKKTKGGSRVVEPPCQPNGNSSSSTSSSESTSLPESKKDRPECEQEVIDFCQSIGVPDGPYFWEKWNGNGFKNNNKSMRDWKAVIRAWKHGGYLPSQKSRRPATASPNHTAQEGEQW